MMSEPKVGIQLGATIAPEEIVDVAVQAEELGYGEIWMAEDYFQLGGISSVATALAATTRIPVGLGVVAAGVRHPAVTAMEFATLSATHRNRFMAGIGHGATSWVKQMGLQPDSPLGLLREATEAVAKLLGGGAVTKRGSYFTFDDVRLHRSPSTPPPIYLGVHGPASLRLSGEVADGTLLGWFSSPDYVAWARQRIDEGRTQGTRDDHHDLVVLCLLSISDEEPAGARRDLGRWAAPMLAAMSKSPQLRFSNSGQELAAIIETDNQLLLAEGPPDRLLGDFVAAGDAASCAATIGNLLDAGADRVVLVPNPAGYRSTAGMLDQMGAAAVLTKG